jgi:hypothetical protein
MTTTNDAMYVALKALYPSIDNPTLGDLLYAFWSDQGINKRGSLQYDFYVDAGAVGTTWGDLANSYWSDPDFVVSNLELEDGTDLLLEDGSFMLLEAGNV